MPALRVRIPQVYDSCLSSGNEAMSVLTNFLWQTGLRVGEIHVTEMGVTDAGLKAVLEALDAVDASKGGPIWLQVRNNRLTKKFVERVCAEGGCLGENREVCGTDWCRYARTRFHLYGAL